MPDDLKTELRRTFTHCVYAAQFGVAEARHREESELMADFAGLVLVRRQLLEAIAKLREKRKSPEAGMISRRYVGSSWPFSQVATFPIGLDWLPSKYGGA